MDEVEGVRLRPPSEDSVSLASSLAEPFNPEGQKDKRLLNVPDLSHTAPEHDKHSIYQSNQEQHIPRYQNPNLLASPSALTSNIFPRLSMLSMYFRHVSSV